MTTLIYDGSFEGLMTALYESWYGPARPDRIERASGRQERLGETALWVTTDPAHGDRVMAGIRQRLGEGVLEHVLHAWMSEEPEAGTVVLTFLRHAFKAGGACIRHEAHPAVSPLLKCSRRAARESHRMVGLVRFMLLENGVYYGCIEPDCNILMILASHFANRLGDQPWVLYDARRGLAALYDLEAWRIAEVPRPEHLRFHTEEEAMQRHWREYFSRIAIRERSNPALQRQMMPKKYWKNLIEKN